MGALMARQLAYEPVLAFVLFRGGLRMVCGFRCWSDDFTSGNVLPVRKTGLCLCDSLDRGPLCYRASSLPPLV